MSRNSKLTEEQKNEAIRMISNGVLRKDVAKKLGVSPQTISRATVGVEKPEMRGRHNLKKWNPHYFRDDLDW